MDTQQISDLVVESLDNIKGQHIEVFDVRTLTAITDCMIICTGTSSTHIKAMADEVIVNAKKAGVQVQGIEGRGQADWVLVDLGDVIVHLMLSATRSLYRLEDLWNFKALKPAEKPIEP
ncbi:MAG: ribosome silencing factor [Pseudohongiella sp.]|nr:ribosome silencing factor [Pseudohongiella sp.]MDP2128421.1 ribosome silencing factor [Pseudohongiella sp.]